MRVIPVDLRWGLTKEDTSDEGLGALEHCLLEIDHCRPFFMVLAGERYAWSVWSVAWFVPGLCLVYLICAWFVWSAAWSVWFGAWSDR